MPVLHRTHAGVEARLVTRGLVLVDQALGLGLVDHGDRVLVGCLGRGFVTVGDGTQDFLYRTAITGPQRDIVFVTLDGLAGAFSGLSCIGQGLLLLARRITKAAYYGRFALSVQSLGVDFAPVAVAPANVFPGPIRA